MPRVSRIQTDKNRASIELAAARLLKEQGINGLSVAELMGAAGLTHGGFYGHFDSKESLVAIACNKAFEQSAERIKEKVDRALSPEAALSAITDAYLMNEHRDSPGHGCPVAALASDISREAPDKLVRAAYLKGVKRFLGTLAGLSQTANLRTHGNKLKQQDDAVDQHAKQTAMMQLALLVGAITLARATTGDPLSEAFLAAGRAGIAKIAD